MGASMDRTPGHDIAIRTREGKSWLKPLPAECNDDAVRQGEAVRGFCLGREVQPHAVRGSPAPETCEDERRCLRRYLRTVESQI